MARKKLTRKQRIKGMKAALRSKKTPKHLKKGLRCYLKEHGEL